MIGELVGGNGYSGGQEKDWMVRLEEDMTEFSIIRRVAKGCTEGRANGFDGSRRGQSHSSENGMAWRAVELQSDTRMPRQHRPPSAALRSGGEGGGRGGEHSAQETGVWVWPSLS